MLRNWSVREQQAFRELNLAQALLQCPDGRCNVDRGGCTERHARQGKAGHGELDRDQKLFAEWAELRMMKRIPDLVRFPPSFQRG